MRDKILFDKIQEIVNIKMKTITDEIMDRQNEVFNRCERNSAIREKQWEKLAKNREDILKDIHDKKMGEINELDARNQKNGGE